MQSLFSDNAGAVQPVAVEEGEETVAVATGAVAASAPPGEVNTRADVLKAIDRIVAYYNRSEPTSPVPLLLGRARRLAQMNFMDIMKDLAPDSLSQIQLIGGADESEEGSESSEDSDAGW